jgi:hypothetical protein
MNETLSPLFWCGEADWRPGKLFVQVEQGAGSQLSSAGTMTMLAPPPHLGARAVPQQRKHLWMGTWSLESVTQ